MQLERIDWLERKVRKSLQVDRIDIVPDHTEQISRKHHVKMYFPQALLESDLDMRLRRADPECANAK